MERTELSGVIELTPRRFGDERGYFCETYNRRRESDIGIQPDFVQDNESLSRPVGTIRGIHFQKAPRVQGKLVRVASGAVLDVVVDLRVSSPTFGDYLSVRLDAATGNQLWIPAGFGHGFCTLEPDTVLTYKVTEFYDPECDRSMKFDDADLAIDWPVQTQDALVSEKDRVAPTFNELRHAGELFE